MMVITPHFDPHMKYNPNLTPLPDLVRSRSGKQIPVARTPHKSALLESVRGRCRLKHYSLRTEDAYTNWIKRFILFHNKKHPAEMSGNF